MQPTDERMDEGEEHQQQPPHDMLEQQQVDETPHFLSPDDAVEVPIGDDDDMPMDDEEEDDINEMEDKNNSVVDDDMSRVQLESHNGPVYAVATYWDVTTKQLRILSGGGDDKSFLHNVVVASDSNNNNTTTTISGSSIPLTYPHTDTVSSVAFNLPYVVHDDPQNPPKTAPQRLAAVGGYDGAIVIYNPDTGQQLQTMEGPSDVEWLHFHPKGGGTVLLAGSAADGTVWMYHVPLKKCLQVFVGHESAVTAGAFSPDGKWALTASADGTLRIWAPKTGMSKHVFRLSNAGLTCMGIHGGSDGRLVMVGGEDGQAHVCHIGTKKVVATVRHFDAVSSSSSQPNVSSSEEEDELQLPTSVEAVAFAPQAVNPNWCATGGVDGVLKVWDLGNNGQCRQVCKTTTPQTEGGADVESNDGGITRMTWHPTLPLILASYTNGFVRVWDTRNGRLAHTLTTGSSEVLNDLSVQWVDDGKSAVIVTASDDGKVRVFELNVTAILDTFIAASS